MLNFCCQQYIPHPKTTKRHQHFSSIVIDYYLWNMIFLLWSPNKISETIANDHQLCKEFKWSGKKLLTKKFPMQHIVQSFIYEFYCGNVAYFISDDKNLFTISWQTLRLNNQITDKWRYIYKWPTAMTYRWCTHI